MQKIFYNDNDENQPVQAAGSLIYRINKDKNDIEFLLIHNFKRNFYEDFGGHTNFDDKNVFDTIARETNEESNYNLKFKSVKKRVMKSKLKVYIKKSKYLIYFIKATDTESNLVKSDFGNIEELDKIKRTVNWYPVNKILKKEFIDKLNFRLKNRYVFNIMKDLQSSID